MGAAFPRAGPVYYGTVHTPDIRPLVTACLACWAGLVAAACAPGNTDTAPAESAAPSSVVLWNDVTSETIGDTRGWTNKVEIADLNGDGRPDLLFANGGDYSTPGTPEANLVFFNTPTGTFENRSAEVLGPTPDLARVIKARDLNADGIVDIIVGTTFQTQSRLFLGSGEGAFREVTATHLPRMPLSVGDVEAGDVDGDGDLDLVLADWGPGDNMSNSGGRTRLWLNDGAARFTDATAAQMPETLVGFSWDLELADIDNDYDLDLAISCKRCPGSYLFMNDGTGRFTNDARALPQYTNNYELEPMDLDGDGFLDLVTINDGDIIGERSYNRKEHVFHNDGRGRFRDATSLWWPAEVNIGEDDNMAAFLDYDSDGDADFVIGSLTGPDRLLINDGTGTLSLAIDVFDGPGTPGTLGIALADLDGDFRMDVVQAQGEHETAVSERVYLRPRPESGHRPAIGVPGRHYQRRGNRRQDRPCPGARPQEPDPSNRMAARGRGMDIGRQPDRGADAVVRRGPVASPCARGHRRERHLQGVCDRRGGQPDVRISWVSTSPVSHSAPGRTRH